MNAKTTRNLPVKHKSAPLPVRSEAEEFEAMAGAGLETVTPADLLIPRLDILQVSSPKVNKKRGEYVKEAEPGLIIDHGLNELFADGVYFCPCAFRKVFLEWQPRESGGGLAGIHQPEASAKIKRDEKGYMDNGNILQETSQIYGLNLSTQTLRQSFIPMKSTQLKKARGWLSKALDKKLQSRDGKWFQAPFFSSVYHLTSVEESNAKGDWHGWAINEFEDGIITFCEKNDIDFTELKRKAMAFDMAIKSGDAQPLDVGERDE